MVKIWSRFLCCFFLLSSLYVTSAASHEDLSDAELIQILKKEYSDWVGNNTEKLIFIGNDGKIFRILGTPEYISISTYELKKILAHGGHIIATISICVHNHNKNEDFSRADYNLYRYLKRNGFKGRFLIYFPQRLAIKEIKAD